MREPTYVAQLAATLDELSNGRAEVVFDLGEQGRIVGEQVLPEVSSI